MKKYLKQFYELLPFKKQVFELVRMVLPLPKKLHAYFYFTGVFKTRTEVNSFLMKNYGYQFHVENELFWGGIKNGWEKESTKLWVKLCRDKKTVFDIGANTGFYSVLTKALNPTAKVYAFEPLPSVYQKLKLNNDLNHFDIRCNELALGNVNGEAKVYPTSLDHVYSVTVNKNMTSHKKTYELNIRTKRLDDFIEENKVEQIDLIKIDVETFEVQVLEGMGKYLEIMKPDWLIEIQTDEIADGISRLIKNIDYVFFNINEKKGITRVEKLGKSDTLNYLICKRETAKQLQLI